MHVDEVDVRAGTVRLLVDSQFPAWRQRRLRRVARSGTDNAIFRLGADLAVRLPRIGWAVGQIERETTWLGRLAPHLPLAVPEPVAEGRPDHGYPYPWLVYRWVAGRDLEGGGVRDPGRLATDLGAFVATLHGVEVGDGPAAGRRGGALAPYDEVTGAAIGRLAGEIDAGRATAVWRAGLEADPWPGPPVWVHGDLLPGNIVVRRGRLAGVVDWGAVGLGDPACDAMVAWSMAPPERRVFRRAVGCDAATWARGRAWVVEQTALFIPYYEKTLPEAVAGARTRLRAVLGDDDR